MGTLEQDGSEFDSSRGRGDPFTFTLGQGQVIKGWDVGVATMKKGELSKLYIRSDYGYGDAGSPPKIPANAALVFEVELLSWKSVKDIVGNGSVIKSILSEGAGWATPKDADEVTVEIVGRVQGADAPFYASGPAGGGDEFYVHQGLLCDAVAVAVKTMKKGEAVKLVVQPEYGFGEKGRGEEVPPGAVLEIEMKLVSFKKVENVTPDGGVVKKILKETEEWQKPNAGATVTVAYTARRLSDGSVLEERSETEPLTFITEEDQAPCEGFELGVMQMKKGERALLTVTPPYTPSASTGASADAGVTYEVTLIDFVKVKEAWDLDIDEKLAAAAAAKDKGNAAFKSGKLDRAMKLWGEFLLFLFIYF